MRRLSDLFDVTVDDLTALPGFAQKSAEKLVAAIDARRSTELARFLHALGIPEVGTTVARDLASHFQSVDALRAADRETLESVPGIGPKMSEQIRAFFDDERSMEVVDALLAKGLELSAPESKADGPLSGKRFVFTGGMESMSRGEAKRLVEELGGKVTSSVSKETDFVVAGANAGAKLEKATALELDVLTEEQFTELLTNPDAHVAADDGAAEEA